MFFFVPQENKTAMNSVFIFILEIRTFFWIARKCIWILVEKKCSFFLCHRKKNLLFLFQTEQNIYISIPLLFSSFLSNKHNNNNKFHICIKWLYLNYIKHLFLLLCLFKTKIAHNWSFLQRRKNEWRKFFLYSLMLMKRAS